MTTKKLVYLYFCRNFFIATTVVMINAYFFGMFGDSVFEAYPYLTFFAVILFSLVFTFLSKDWKSEN